MHENASLEKVRRAVSASLQLAGHAVLRKPCGVLPDVHPAGSAYPVSTVVSHAVTAEEIVLISACWADAGQLPTAWFAAATASSRAAATADETLGAISF